MARILIVDDHDVVRQGTRAILQRARPDWEICGEASTGREAIRAVEAFQPDVVILDISMPEMTGIEATPVIAKMAPNCRILLFTMHESNALLAEAKELGAQGYVQKSQAGRDLVIAVDQLLRGGTFFGPQGVAGSGNGNPGLSNGGNPGHGISSSAHQAASFQRERLDEAGVSSIVNAGKVDKFRKVLQGMLRMPSVIRNFMCLMSGYLQRVESGVRVA